MNQYSLLQYEKAQLFSRMVYSRLWVITFFPFCLLFSVYRSRCSVPPPKLPFGFEFGGGELMLELVLYSTPDHVSFPFTRNSSPAWRLPIKDEDVNMEDRGWSDQLSVVGDGRYSLLVCLGEGHAEQGAEPCSSCLGQNSSRKRQKAHSWKCSFLTPGLKAFPTIHLEAK